MAHPLVTQLRFTRSEWLRALKDVSAEDAQRRLPPMNSISWIIGHLTWQEHRYWIMTQEKVLLPHLNQLVGYGAPASSPPLDEMWEGWHTVTRAADPYLDTLTSETLQVHAVVYGETVPESMGTLLRRTTYHYWYHMGEALAIRQMLGHTDLPDFVGDIGDEAPYWPEHAVETH
ncbi:MAG TPA: DinB family protein [Ktedonosporobacter sp.]|nr:DinB family protein [Ktedonosporobacter sp.]